MATSSRHKLEELRDLARALAPDLAAGEVPALELVSAADCGGMPAVPEDTGSFIGNARQKARALKERLPQDAWVLADDSGLCVDALGGAPGVDSSRFAGVDAGDRRNLEKLLRDLAGVSKEQRTARFVCVLVLAGPGEAEEIVEGACSGRLIEESRGTGGFGYDPIFVPDGYDQTFAELGAETKNRISHRARAWSALLGRLRARGT